MQRDMTTGDTNDFQLNISNMRANKVADTISISNSFTTWAHPYGNAYVYLN